MKTIHETTMSNTPRDDSDNRCIPICARIISTIPPLSSLFRKRRSGFKYDENSTIFVTAKDGQTHGIKDGSLCRLYRKHSHYWGVPVILRLVDHCNDNCHVEEMHSDGDSLRDVSGLIVYLNPCLAATLGLHWFHMRYKQSSIVASLEILTINGQSSVMEASRATLREIGILPPTPSYRSSFQKDTVHENKHDSNGLSNQQQTNTSKSDVEEDSRLKQFFTHQTKQQDNVTEVPRENLQASTAKFKPRKRLLTLGSIFATSSGENHSKNVRFYQVVDIHSSTPEAIDSSNPWNAYYVSPLTTLVASSLETHDKLTHWQAAGFAWRLPRPSIVASFLQSIQDARNHASCDTYDSSEISKANKDCIFHPHAGRMVRHPSANQVADAIYLQALSANSETCRVCPQAYTTPSSFHDPSPIHIVGGEENHVSACVAEAADIMGMRYFRVDGLAAFWAHCTFLRSYPQQTLDNSSRILTGQLPDKLNGLAAAVKFARQSFPCVLHVVGIDDELSPATGHGADADSRREEEQRFLQVIYEATLESLNQRPFASSNGDIGLSRLTLHDTTDLTHSITPLIIVVFSSSCSLPSGPITSSIEQNSINLLSPDASYARYLWNNDVDETFDSAAPMLVGLSARDIEFLRQKFVSLWKNGKERKCEDVSNDEESSVNSLSDNIQQTKSSLVQSIMNSLLGELETKNILTQPSRSSGGSSTVPLSSTSLPNVRWEDIGGLSAVRKEIMDAVELPLKHPELFEGSRRSGILLFGPPGTGKTLVAKAVARECGLPFLSIKGPELLGSYVGESEANVRAVFEAARVAASSSVKPHSLDSGFKNGCTAYGGASVLFFDELDSLAPRRGETGHGDGVMERVVATLLGELDNGTGGGGERTAPHSSTGMSCSPHVIVIGATNRPDLLDPSLLRPGRFDRLLYLGPAKTKDACLQILLAQTRKFKFEDGHDREVVLREAMESFPPTLSGADLSAVASGALMLALKRVCDEVEEEVRTINAKRGVDEKSDEGVDVNDVMDSWTKEQLQPTVTVGDFVNAAKHIVPSISAQDLERFETLRNQFSVV